MKPENKTRYYSLDTFRGFAAILVALYHAHMSGVFLPGSWVMVDFFFILSGFILSHVYFYGKPAFSRNDVIEFISHRFARLYPLHIATLVFLLFYFIFVQNHLDNRNSFSFSFLTHLFLINNIGFNTPGVLSWNPPAWSISVEWFVNLVFIYTLTQIKKPLLLLIAIFLYTLLYVSNYNLSHATSALYGLFNIGLIRGFAGFFIGVWLYSIYRHMLSGGIIPNQTTSTILEVLLLFSIAIFFYFYNELHRPDYLVLFLFPLLILVFAFENGVVSKILYFLKTYKLGEWSYGIYLLHFPILYIMQDMHQYIAEEYRLLIYLALLLPISWLVFTYFESPLTKKYRNIFINNDPKQIGALLFFTVLLFFLAIFADGYKLRQQKEKKLFTLYNTAKKQSPIIDNEYEIYKLKNKLVFIKDQCSYKDTSKKFFVHFKLKNGKLINKDFYFQHNGFRLSNGACIAMVNIPNHSSSVHLGQFVPRYGRSWEKRSDL